MSELTKEDKINALNAFHGGARIAENDDGSFTVFNSDNAEIRNGSLDDLYKETQGSESGAVNANANGETQSGVANVEEQIELQKQEEYTEKAEAGELPKTAPSA